jgi:hypothetical protein
MPYDWRIHAHMTGLKMGIHNFKDTRKLAVGDHVTNQHGGAGEFIGEVLNPGAGDGEVMVRWLSDHIGPRQTAPVPRHYLVKADYAPPRDFDDRTYGGNDSTAWVLSAARHGWHVVAGSACNATEMSMGYDGWADAWLRGTKVSIRFNAAGEITWARFIGDYTGRVYASVKQGRGAGRTAMMWLTPGADTSGEPPRFIRPAEMGMRGA